MAAVTVLPVDRHELAESPRWDAATGTISWVDIPAGRLTVARPLPDAQLEILRTLDLDGPVGCAFRLGDARFLLAMGRRLGFVSALGDVTTSRDLLPEDQRFNDGVIDPAGRLIVGSTSRDPAGPHEGNVLVRLEHDGEITTLDTGLGISNGLAFAPDGRTLYSVDSAAGDIYARDYDYESGSVGQRRLVVHIDDAGVEPDGLAVDNDGGIWVALWGGGAVRRFSPDGAHDRDVEIGVPHVTAIAFIGSHLEHALVTTAMRDLDEDARARFPDAGRVFVATDLGVTGLTGYRWRPGPLPQ
ncbi:MAG TPA: SMP-30/gluconolactonase/LRE family protein [Microcella sp.]|nr:SMP-30/gluconolactonase/LRE family protein [Microcella sp.]